MPSINFSISRDGPIITVIIGISALYKGALIAAGLSAPPPVRGKFLIDTGASRTCIDSNLVGHLGLPSIGSIEVQTPSTKGISQACKLCDAMLFIPGKRSAGYRVSTLALIEVSLAGQGIDGLIGRDLLNRWTCIYNGTAASFSLCY
ncbi:hypothetical protein D0T25_07635 [Duganella sp. BJB488]|uniref:aspartyl protease family protein n=1 Tax=unclassified Duganella TaxID=2636909 RepID=UPI000E3471A6|nr:aspartyl protease family protein [Duganella sp. BJB1802]NVD70086.1 aspartyl protease family protein [Duganella sp. BJB1802]RFP23006.1 hypothetical protein D0T26_08215 [Duganella sp. BJB489]RFP24917.1 hypothetical protein D0T25_07635 [Duganella sp. BJB488]RFP34006.1 hypothetical protein D0T24_16595 [Duganella sp. BJB480]